MSSEATAQSLGSINELGLQYIQHFSPRDYSAHAQNWSITQSTDGLIYVGNSDGILEYDGVNWRLIELTTGSIVRSIFASKRGRIYAGGRTEFGYLEADSVGMMQYHSLTHLLPDSVKTFTNVWSIHEAHDGIYFHTYEGLFRLRDQTLDVFQSDQPLLAASSIQDTLYVQIRNKGIRQVTGDSLAQIPGGDFFSEMRIIGFASRKTDQFIALTSSNGMFECNLQRSNALYCSPFHPELTPTLTSSRPYAISSGPNGDLVIGTLGSGAFFLDPSGQLFRNLNASNELNSDPVLDAFFDHQGGVWLGLNNGIARLSVNTSITYFDKKTGLRGSVSSVKRFGGELYVATTFGVQKLIPSRDGALPAFTQVIKPDTQCLSLVTTKATLLASCADGVYDVIKRERVFELKQSRLYDLYMTTRDSTRLFISHARGLSSARLEGNTWTFERNYDIQEIIRSFAEDSEGNLWMGATSGYVFGIRNSDLENPTSIIQFGQSDGLPEGSIKIKNVAGRVLVYSKDKETVDVITQRAGSFELMIDSLFEKQYNHTPQFIYEMAEDKNGRLWIFSKSALGVAQPQENIKSSYQAFETQITPAQFPYEMYAESNGVGWVGGPFGLLRLEATKSKNTHQIVKPWIRRITTSGDSLLFGGQHGINEESFVGNPEIQDVRFMYSAPLYRAPKEIEYRTKLAGLNNTWSEWSKETTSSYTNLSHGTYTFYVQARDLKGQLSQQTPFTFSILPPWHHTPFAYVLWALLSGITIYGVAIAYNHARSRKILAKNRVLEQQIALRTREIHEQKRIVEEANEELTVINTVLQDTNKKLEDRTDSLRDALEANKEILGITAHDLKNPLGGIIGLADMILEDLEEGLQATYDSAADHVPMLKDEAERMLQIIKELLDKQREGEKADLKKEKTELSQVIVAVLRWNNKQASNKEILLHYQTESTYIVEIDVMAIQRVLDNYVSNAIKYSPIQSNVWIEIDPLIEDVHLGSSIRVSVRDEGPGLTEEDKQKVFGKMQRLSAEPTAGEHSTGLGLYIVKQLVEAHGGTVGVESTYGQGSSFWFSLPVCESHQVDRLQEAKVTER